MIKQWRHVFAIFNRYWIAYGGWSSLIRSPYFQVSVLISYFLQDRWDSSEWSDISISVLPAILGLTIAGYSIWLGVGDDNFKRRLAKRRGSEGGASAFLTVNAVCVHFVVVQVMALLFSVFFQGQTLVFPGFYCWAEEYGFNSVIWDVCGFFLRVLRYWIPAVGCFLFIYSLMLVFALIMALFRYASWYDQYLSRQKR